MASKKKRESGSHNLGPDMPTAHPPRERLPSQSEIAASTARALLDAEKRASVTLENATKLRLLELEAELGRLTDPVQIALKLRDGMNAVERAASEAIANAIKNARTTAAGPINLQLGAARNLGIHVPTVNDPSRVAVDTLKAQVAAQSYRAALHADIQARIIRGINAGLAMRSAIENQNHRLSSISTTETAQAFNNEIFVTAQQLAVSSNGLRAFRRWDARLDARVCSKCAALDGEEVPIDETFGEYEPGHVHPRCRCYSVIVILPADKNPAPINMKDLVSL